MHGLPPNIDLSFLVGKTLLQLCFAEHQLILKFEQDISISIESEIGFCLPEGKAVHKWEDFRQGASFLVALANHNIETVKGTPNGTLTLQFQGGGVVELYDNSNQFESYIIKNRDKTIVV